jgi:hypothetical protein
MSSCDADHEEVRQATIMPSLVPTAGRKEYSNPIPHILIQYTKLYFLKTQQSVISELECSVHI